MGLLMGGKTGIWGMERDGEEVIDEQVNLTFLDGFSSLGKSMSAKNWARILLPTL